MSEETLPISDSATSDSNESESETPGDKTGDRATGITDLRG